MEPHDELESWRLEWQADGSVPRELRARVDGQARRRTVAFWLSVAVTMVMGGGSTIWAIQSGESSSGVVVAAVWLFIGITWATSVQLERMSGPSAPLTETTAAFLEAAIRGCRVRRRGIALAAALYAGFFSFMVAWRFGQLAAEEPLDVWTYLASGRVLTQVAITAALALVAVLRRRRLSRELHRLTRLKQGLG